MVNAAAYASAIVELTKVEKLVYEESDRLHIELPEGDSAEKLHRLLGEYRHRLNMKKLGRDDSGSILE
jgi:hypothetical protein